MHLLELARLSQSDKDLDMKAAHHLRWLHRARSEARDAARDAHDAAGGSAASPRPSSSVTAPTPCGPARPMPGSSRS